MTHPNPRLGGEGRSPLGPGLYGLIGIQYSTDQAKTSSCHIPMVLESSSKIAEQITESTYANAIYVVYSALWLIATY